jgi:hypothetical protein
VGEILVEDSKLQDTDMGMKGVEFLTATENQGQKTVISLFTLAGKTLEKLLLNALGF